MALVDQDISLVQTSWTKVERIGLEAVGVLLFKNIFEAAPGALELFSFKDVDDLYNNPKLKAHGITVVSTVGKAVGGLRDIESLVPVLQSLGSKHGSMKKGIGSAHYDIVGAALMKTLSQGLGEDFTPEVEKAWTTVYAIVAKTMLAAH
jgi:methyl-accepting chemotaxis protein